MYRIIQKRKIWFTLSTILTTLSIVSIFAFGLNFGVDFKGGSLLEVKFLDKRPDMALIKDSLKDVDISGLVVQPVEEDGVILRFKEVSEDLHNDVLLALNDISQDKEFFVEQLSFDSVGPSIGQELKRKSIYAIIWVLIAIILFIAWVFRKVSKPVESWKYGIVAIIALFHDIVIILGVFAILGRFFGTEINAPFIAALLTVLGYSINDTIVVFDRLRENLPKSKEDFEGTVNTSVNQTLTRSINTSLTTLIVLLSIVIFGGSSVKDFIAALSIGVLIGTYSSIFLASPLLVIVEKMKK